VRTCPTFFAEAALQLALPFDEITLIVERFDAFRSVGRDEAQLVRAGVGLLCCRSLAQVTNPSSPGISTSRTIASGRSVSAAVSVA
jgi:hypothetical protein